MGDLVFSTASQLAAMIRDREVSAVEVLDAHLAQIEQHNQSINAIVTFNHDARMRASEADVALGRGEVWGPLHGVPVTIKDAIETAGLRTTGGYEPLADYVPSEDAPVVERLKDAGAVIVGKTNLPPLSGDYRADNPIFGRTNNPWNLDCCPGGSTGGGAAAVAAGMSPLEIGSDIGGSVRIPAHYCGIFSLKTSEWRVPTTGHIPEPPDAPRGIRHMQTIGPLARSVDDLELALRIISGPDGRQWEVPPAPIDSVPVHPLNELRLAWMDGFNGVPVTRDTRAGLEQLALELGRRGCKVERRSPSEQGFDFGLATEIAGHFFRAELGSTMSRDEEEEMFADFLAAMEPDEPLARGMRQAHSGTVRGYTAALAQRDSLISALERFLDNWDALICPVTVSPAVPHVAFGSPIEVDDQTVTYWQGGIAYTSPFNLTGSPVVVLPLTQSSEGLPIGVQVVGKRWSEMAILNIARELASITGGFQRPPRY